MTISEFGDMAWVVWRGPNILHGGKCILNSQEFGSTDATSVKPTMSVTEREASRFDSIFTIILLLLYQWIHFFIFHFVGSILSARSFGGVLSICSLLPRSYRFSVDDNRWTGPNRGQTAIRQTSQWCAERELQVNLCDSTKSAIWGEKKAWIKCLHFHTLGF